MGSRQSTRKILGTVEEQEPFSLSGFPLIRSSVKFAVRQKDFYLSILEGLTV